MISTSCALSSSAVCLGRINRSSTGKDFEDFEEREFLAGGGGVLEVEGGLHMIDLNKRRVEPSLMQFGAEWREKRSEVD